MTDLKTFYIFHLCLSEEQNAMTESETLIKTLLNIWTSPRRQTDS